MSVAHQMATARSSNMDRAAYRTKCRRKLSDYIRKVVPSELSSSLTEYQVLKLGLFVEPAEVRLITGADDLYTWQMLPEKTYLFKKQLSKHSTGAYRELCRGVGVSFEAVAVENPRPGASIESDKERADFFSIA